MRLAGVAFLVFACGCATPKRVPVVSSSALSAREISVRASDYDSRGAELMAVAKVRAAEAMKALGFTAYAYRYRQVGPDLDSESDELREEALSALRSGRNLRSWLVAQSELDEAALMARERSGRPPPPTLGALTKRLANLPISADGDMVAFGLSEEEAGALPEADLEANGIAVVRCDEVIKAIGGRVDRWLEKKKREAEQQ